MRDQERQQAECAVLGELFSPHKLTEKQIQNLLWVDLDILILLVQVHCVFQKSEFLALELDYLLLLNLAPVFSLLMSGKFSSAQFTRLGAQAKMALWLPGIDRIIASHPANAEAFPVINQAVRFALSREGIRYLLLKKKITIDKLLGFDEPAIDSLHETGMVEAALNGEYEFSYEIGAAETSRHFPRTFRVSPYHPWFFAVSEKMGASANLLSNAETDIEEEVWALENGP